MSTDPQRGATPSSRPSQSPPSEGPGQGPAQGRRGGIDSPMRSSRSRVSTGLRAGPSSRLTSNPSRRSGNSSRPSTPTTSRRVKTMMTRNPALHSAPLGYGKDGPLTWVAECRVPWEPPSPVRLAMAEWMIAHGSDVHQGGDGPLMRAALNAYRIPMMELLVSHGADVNALWHGHFPIIFAPCESLDPAALKWLLDHGANPNCRDHGYEISGHPYPGTALDYLIAGYARSVERLSACIDILLEAGGETKYDAPAVLAAAPRPAR